MAVLKDCASSGREPPRHIYMETLQKLMSAGMDQTVPEEYIPLLMEETRRGDDDIRSGHWQHDPARLPIQGFKVIIIGAGSLVCVRSCTPRMTTPAGSSPPAWQNQCGRRVRT
jgi:hypothetical protein